MRLKWRPRYLKRGIALRISLLCWLISLSTLSIFVAVIIPEQKRDLQNALLSKARGVTSSLQEVTAGAALTDDYSSVVDQCSQVLAGDEAIDYLVITKNDGFSVIVERSGWRTAQLGEDWRPPERRSQGAIQTMADLHRRVFHFARPFDYSAIQWGWMHIGLSLTAYDQSVRRIYWRTGWLTIICVILSLLVSVGYAKRQVQPILSLQSAVHQVAQGNLSVRPVIRSGDEVESLAESFNLMTASILQRNDILDCMRFAAQEFLSARDVRTVLDKILGRMGTATKCSHAWTCEGCAGRAGAGPTVRYEWTTPGIGLIAGPRVERDCCRWGSGGELGCCTRENGGRPSPDLGEALLTDGGPAVKSALVVPIVVNDVRLGFLGIDDCVRQREWSTAEHDCLRAVAGMVAVTITRHRAQNALEDANNRLEMRVVERTRELQEQVNAKERAHRELAAAQENLIALSRFSGMAEIATSVLHNVGNVLNSVNVSTTILADLVRALRAENLASLVTLLQEHEADAADFFANDPQGKRVLPYLAKLAAHFQGTRGTLLTEVEQLRSHVEHIKIIVVTQQSYAKVSGVVENLNLPELADDACRILLAGFDRHRIRVERDYGPVPLVMAEKHVVMQILLNVMRNAKDAIKERGITERVIRIRVWQSDEAVRVEVRDNGIGIAHQNLTRIFSHGFTTKPQGHGFGLHSSAVDAQKLGGSLSAASDGPGCGAAFTLELPLQKRTDRSAA